MNGDRTETALNEVKGTSKPSTNSGPGLSGERLAEIERLARAQFFGDSVMVESAMNLARAANELLAEVKRLQAGTVEYAVQCAMDGFVPRRHMLLPDADRNVADFLASEADLDHDCGPHRVVQRSASPWRVLGVTGEAEK